MGFKGVRVWSTGLVFALLILSSSVPVLAAERFAIVSSVGGAPKLYYDPNTGVLFREITEQGQLKRVPLNSFGKIPNLTSSQVRIIAAPDKKSDANFIAIRHGYWISVIDVANDKSIATNIGPIDPLPGRLVVNFGKVLVTPKGKTYLTFVAATSLKNPGTSQLKEMPLFFVVDADNGNVGFFPMRESILPKEVKIEMHGENLITIGAEIDYPLPPTVIEGKVVGGGVGTSKSVLVLDLITGEMTSEGETPNLLATDRWQNRHIKSVKLFQGLMGADALMMHAPMMITDASPKALDETGNPNDIKAREISLRVVRERIDGARTIAQRIRDAMKGLHGQEAAVEAMVSFAQRQVDATKFKTVVFGGPTGTGKTTGFKTFVGALYSEAKEPAYVMSLADSSDEFLKTELFGSKPGYIGSESPTGLQNWMLANPDGGGILFDEVDKASLASVNILLSFLSEGEVKIGPHLTKVLCKNYEKTPISQWPKALLEATEGGANPNVEIVLKLTPKHIIGFGTNAGAELFNGSGTSSVAGRRLRSEAELRAANNRFSGENIKAELRARGFKDEWLNRISAYIPFKVLLPEHHGEVVKDLIATTQNHLEEQYRVRLDFSEEAKKFYNSETYSPLDGVRSTQNSVEAWLGQKLSHALVQDRSIAPGDHVLVNVAAGDGKSIPSRLQLIRKSDQKMIAEYDVGKPLPPRPTALLERAKSRLRETLERRIVGHRDEIELVTKAIISQLAKAVYDPERQGRPIVLYFDGTPGVGKTELAKAINEALFDDADGLRRVNMNEIKGEHSFYSTFVEPIRSSIATNPEHLVALLDELPRMGDPRTGSNFLIQSLLMAVFDEGKLPAIPGESREVNGRAVAVTAAPELPPVTIFLCTGNLLVQALGEGAEHMSLKELKAHFRLMLRHPEKLKEIYSQVFEDAFRSRLGEPILFAPSTEEEMAILRDRFFEIATSILKKNGVNAILTDSAKKYFEEFAIALRGNRWTREQMEKFVEAPVNTLILGSEEKYKGTTFEIVFDEKALELKANITRDGSLEETVLLSKVHRSKMEYHPESRARALSMVAIHEAGHAIVRRVLYGIGAVAEVNAFGGGEGGWMEKAFDIVGQDVFTNTRKGPYELAVSLGGHAAEELFVPESGTSTGASSDFANTRGVAQNMIMNGGVLGIAPIPLIKNPSTGQYEMSEATRLDLERKQGALMDFAGRLARHIILQNKAVLMAVAKELAASPELSLSREQFEAIVTGRDGSELLTVPTQKQIRKLITADPTTRNVCQTLLLKGDAQLKAGGLSAWLQRISDRLFR
jgi:ATP-dependent Clp protease ATP-binding subunit ClpA